MNKYAKKQQELIQLYIRAKDNNKPHLMPLAFSSSSTLTMDVLTDTITFPPHIAGCNLITDTLVSNFADRFDNV